MSNPNKISERQFEHAAKNVLLKKQPMKPAKFENREPSKAELNQRFRLERRRG